MAFHNLHLLSHSSVSSLPGVARGPEEESISELMLVGRRQCLGAVGPRSPFRCWLSAPAAPISLSWGPSNSVSVLPCFRLLVSPSEKTLCFSGVHVIQSGHTESLLVPQSTMGHDLVVE